MKGQADLHSDADSLHRSHPRAVPMTRSGLLRDSRVHLTVLLTLIAAAHLAWLHVDESPPGSDEAMYAKAALRFSDAVTGKGTVSYRALFDPAGSRQPIPVWTAGIAVLLGADDPVRAGRALNFIPLFMLGFGVFALSRRLGGKGDLALLAATLSCLYLPLVHLSRHFWAHYWLVAVLPLALWALLPVHPVRFDRRRGIVDTALLRPLRTTRGDGRYHNGVFLRKTGSAKARPHQHGLGSRCLGRDKHTSLRRVIWDDPSPVEVRG